MAKVKVVIGVEDDSVSDLAAVVDRLRAAGVEVHQALEALGTVTGTVDSAALESVCALEGVAAVETSRSFRLRPPDSDIQ
jgi:hypothetical protein